MSQSTIDASTVNGIVCLKERQYAAMYGRYGRTITVGPRGVRDVSSTVFRSRNRNSLRPSEIVIFLDGKEFEKTFIPETLVHFVKLTFELDSNGDMLVYGIRPRLTDLITHFWGLSFLGRNYVGRKRELILRSRMRYCDVPS